MYGPNGSGATTSPYLKIGWAGNQVPGAPQQPSDGGGGGTQQGMPIPDVDPFMIQQANDAYARAVAAIQSRRRNTLTSYGFQSTGFDDQGNPTGLGVDPHSMYGKYQQMLDSQAHASMDASDAGAAAGFSGGLANRGESALKYAQGGERLNMSNSMLGEFSAEEQDQINAQAARDQAILMAYLQGAQSGDFTPASDPGPGPSSPPPAPSGGGSKKTPTARATTLAKKVVSGYSQKSRANLH